MPTIIISSIILLFVIAAIFVFQLRMRKLETLMARANTTIAKISKTLAANAANAAIAQNAEIIYQDLLQSFSPIAAALECAPRGTSEHELWRTIGGVLDAYSRDPFVLEKLRRLIKQDPEMLRHADAFIARGEKLLAHLSDADPDGLLAQTFTDGMLGNAMMFLAQAKELAQNN